MLRDSWHRAVIDHILEVLRLLHTTRLYTNSSIRKRGRVGFGGFDLTADLEQIWRGARCAALFDFLLVMLSNSVAADLE